MYAKTGHVLVEQPAEIPVEVSGVWVWVADSKYSEGLRRFLPRDRSRLDLFYDERRPTTRATNSALLSGKKATGFDEEDLTASRLLR